MKTCKKCKVEKKLTEFHTDKTLKDGLSSGCKACRKEYSQRYYAHNRDRVLEYNKRYYAHNKEAITEGRKGYPSEYYKRYRAENRDVLNEYNRRYRQENPDVVQRYNSKRRALRANATVEGTYLPTNEELVAYYGSACLYPDCTATVPTLDHVIPLSKGGKHALWNFQPLCMYHNQSKQATDTDYRTGKKWIEQIPLSGNRPLFESGEVVTIGLKPAQSGD